MLAPPAPSLPPPTRRRARTRDDPHGVDAGWRARLVARCLDAGAAGRAALRADARGRRRAVVSALRAAPARGGGGGRGSGTGADGGRGVRGGGSRRGDSCTLSDGEIDALVAELEEALERERRAEEEELLVAAAHELYVTSQADDDADVAELGAFSQASDPGRAPPAAADPCGARGPAVGLAEGRVLCPACARGWLLVRHGTVSCACGLRIAGGAEGDLTPEAVRRRLDGVLSEHAVTGCPARPVFSAHDERGLGLISLHAACGRCRLQTIAF